MLEQVDGGRAEDQEAPLAPSAASALVDQAAQALEELAGALDLIEDDSLVGVLRQLKFRFSQLGAASLRFQVEIDARA